MKLSSSDIGNLDKSISNLFECNPLPEAEVKFICDKVLSLKKIIFATKFLRQNPF